jgi:hypothetical protein
MINTACTDNINNSEQGNLPNSDQLSQNNMFGKISEDEIIQFKKNTNTKVSNIYVGYSDNEQLFMFKNIDNQYIGSFSIPDTIKYFGSVVDPQKQFMKHLNELNYTNSAVIIKQFIGYPTYKELVNYIDIKLHDYDSSPFMGDIEMLVKLNEQLHKFEQLSLSNELQYVDEKYRHKVELTIKKLIYSLLNYTLNLISTMSELIKLDTDKDRLKQELIKYSVGTVYRISQFVQQQLKIVMIKNDQIHKTLTNSMNLRKIVESKLDGYCSISQHGANYHINNLSSTNTNSTDIISLSNSDSTNTNTTTTNSFMSVSSTSTPDSFTNYDEIFNV